jgi:hypothetical protein
MSVTKLFLAAVAVVAVGALAAPAFAQAVRRLRLLAI